MRATVSRRTALRCIAAKLTQRPGDVWQGCFSAQEAALLINAGAALVSPRTTFDHLTVTGKTCSVWFHFTIPAGTAASRAVVREAASRRPR